MSRFKPFADDTATLAIGEFTVENGTQSVLLYGTLDITRDQAGLDRAHELAALANDIVATLEAIADLPAHALVPPKAPGQTVKNPFAGN